MAGLRRQADRKTAGVAAGVIVVGLALSALAWGYLRPPAGALNDPAVAAHATPGYIPGGYGCRPAQIARLKGGPYYRPRLDRCAQAAEAHRLQVETLKAQTRAAHAGWAEARLVYWLTKILVVATIFTGWILGAMLWAAWALSRRPAGPTVEPVDAARPLLQLDGVSVTRRDGASGFFVKLNWKNVGEARAIIEDCVVSCDDLEQLPATPDYAAAVAIACPPTLGAGAGFQTGGFGPAVTARAGEVRNLAQREPRRVAVYGRLTYRDGAGRRRATGFSMEVAPDAQAMRRLADPAYDYSE